MPRMKQADIDALPWIHIDGDEVDTQLEEPDPLIVLGHVDEQGRVHFVEGSDVE